MPAAPILLAAVLFAPPETQVKPAQVPSLPRVPHITSENLKSSCLSPDGTNQLVFDKDNTVDFLDSETGEKRFSVEVAYHFVDKNGFRQSWTSVDGGVFSANGDLVVFRCGPKLQIHDGKTGELLDTHLLKGRQAELLGIGGPAMTISPDGRFLALWYPGVHTKVPGADDKTVGNGFVIDLESHETASHTRGLIAATSLGDGQLVGVVQDEPTKRMQLWDLKTQKPIRDFEGQNHFRPTKSTFSSDGRYYVLGDEGRFFAWDTASGKQTLSLPMGKWEHIFELDLSPDNRYLIAASRTGQVSFRLRAWEFSSGKLLWEEKFGLGAIPTSTLILPDNKRVAIEFNGNKPFQIWDLKTGKPSP